MELEFITLENGQDYFVATKTKVKDTIYYMLVNENVLSDIVIRKEVGDELVGLDDMNEFRLAIAKLYQENENNPEITKYLNEFNKK